MSFSNSPLFYRSSVPAIHTSSPLNLSYGQPQTLSPFRNSLYTQASPTKKVKTEVKSIKLTWDYDSSTLNVTRSGTEASESPNSSPNSPKSGLIPSNYSSKPNQFGKRNTLLEIQRGLRSLSNSSDSSCENSPVLLRKKIAESDLSSPVRRQRVPVSQSPYATKNQYVSSQNYQGFCNRKSAFSRLSTNEDIRVNQALEGMALNQESFALYVQSQQEKFIGMMNKMKEVLGSCITTFQDINMKNDDRNVIQVQRFNGFQLNTGLLREPTKTKQDQIQIKME